MNPENDQPATAEAWQKMKQILAGAFDLPTGERTAHVAFHCGDDHAMRDEIMSLLQIDESRAGFLDQHVVWPDGLRDDEVIGRTLGAYRVIRALGEGGMGRVYLAERADGEMDMKVAVKLLNTRASWMSDRFERERQILAQLNHPHIVRVIDGGRLADNQPYLVMEYVQGQTIDLWSQREEVDLRQKLTLFRQVCEAVHEAHKNLIVHRDIKPGNILVNQQGTPKLLDFGIAKLLEATPYLQLANTETAFPAMTPLYASPEQLAGNPITIATDIYSLGMLLYILLTDRYPFDLDDLNTVDAIRLLCEKDPAKPSTRLRQSTQAANAAETARRRHMAKTLTGDLDTIVLKALRKNPADRYPSVEALAEDVQRYLDGFPIWAAEPSMAYRLGKFVKRNRLASAALALAAGLTLALVISTVAQNRINKMERAKAERERDISNQVSRFLTQIFDAGNPQSGVGKLMTAGELLDRAAENIDQTPFDDPLVRAAFLDSMSKAYLGLGLAQEAEPLLNQSFEIRERLQSPEHPDRIRHQLLQADLLKLRGKFDQAAQQYQHVLTQMQAQSTSEEVNTVRLALSRVLRNQDHPKEGLALANTVLAAFQAEPRTQPGHLIEAHTAVAMNAFDVGDLTTAERHYRQAIDLYDQKGWGGKWRLADNLSGLSIVLQADGKFKEAQVALNRGFELRQSISGLNHPASARLLNDLGVLYRKLGEFDKSLDHYRRCLEVKTALFGEENADTALSMQNLASLLIELGQVEEALALAKKALQIQERTLGPNHSELSYAYNTLSLIYRKQNQWDEMEKVALKGIELLEVNFGKNHPRLIIPLINLANFYRDRGNYPQAEALLGRGLVLAREHYGQTHPEIAVILNSLGRIQLYQEHYAEAEPYFLEALEMRESVLGPDHFRTAVSTSDLAQTYLGMGDLAKAQSFATRTLAIRRARLGEEHTATQAAEKLVAQVSEAGGDQAPSQ